MKWAAAVRIALLLAGGVAAVGAAWLLSGRAVRDHLPAGDYAPRPSAEWEPPAGEAAAAREDALRRARVWREPFPPVSEADLSQPAGGADAFDTSALVCKFLPRPPTGTTPKFDCILRGGEVVKVKYGGTAEIHAELAATRLLAALGFGADRMYLVRRLRCHGCPRNPFRTYRVLELVRVDGAYTRRIDFDAFTDFEWVSVERRLDAPAITSGETRGWAFHELDKIDPSRGGASRAEVDALRLVAVFLHHWDNKAQNQRLVCLAGGRRNAEGSCAEPLALLQDVGATFGPSKVSYEKWSARPVWKDAATCAVTMKDLPAEGATFTDVRIGEAGRLFLGERLGRLSERQVRALFAGARFAEFHAPGTPGADLGNWVRAFLGKVREINERPPCPD